MVQIKTWREKRHHAPSPEVLFNIEVANRLRFVKKISVVQKSIRSQVSGCFQRSGQRLRHCRPAVLSGDHRANREQCVEGAKAITVLRSNTPQHATVNVREA